MKKYQLSFVLASSVMLAACVSNPPNLTDVANAAAGGKANTGNATGSLLGALAANAVGGNVNSGTATNALLGSLSGGGAPAAVNSIVDPGPYAKSSCKSLQTDYRKFTPKVKQVVNVPVVNKVESTATTAGQAVGLLASLTGNQQLANTVQQTSALTGNVRGATVDALPVNPNQLKIAQIESAATARNCAITRGDGTKYSAAPVALAPVQAAAPVAPSGAMAALSLASALTGNGNMGNVAGGTGAGGNVGGALLGSFLGANNQPAVPNAASLASLGAYAKMDCKALKNDYAKNSKSAPAAQGGLSDKVASGGAALGLLGSLTGNQNLANMAQQATSVSNSTKPAGAGDNLQKIQLAANAKGCTLN